MKAADLRDLFRDETSLHRMTSSAPPISQNVSESTVAGRVVYDLILEEEPADRIGQSLSGEMVSLIAGIRADFVSYGPRHPVRRALSEWERSCRRRHRSWYDHASPICGEMLRAVVEGGASVWWCSQRYAISYPRAERLILDGINFVGERYTRWEDDQLGIIHDADRCPTCIDEAASMRRNSAPA
jgi:hypothetical protein